MSDNDRHRNMAIVVTRDGMGHTDPDLSQKLIGKWLAIVEENGKLPGAICFYTEGVKLVCEGSPVLEQLESFEKKGVHLIICQTCLAALGLEDRVAVGVVGGMGDIVAAQWMADKVVTL